MYHRPSDFIAELKYKTSIEGGRKTAAYSGYRPQLKFPFTEMQSSGLQKFIDKEIVFPGESVKAKITILSIEFFQNQLSEGMQFEFREGNIVIGTGKILQILNAKLKKLKT